MKNKVVDILFSILPVLIVTAMLGAIVYLLVDNTRLEFVNSVNEYRIEQKDQDIDATKKELKDAKSDLVEWQNSANGYKWQLEQINDEYFMGDK